MEADDTVSLGKNLGQVNKVCRKPYKGLQLVSANVKPCKN